MPTEFPIIKAKEFTDAHQAVDYIDFLYNESCEQIKSAFQDLLDGKVDESAMQEATYPFVGIKVSQQDLHLDAKLSFGVVSEPGHYGSTVTRPDIFKTYYQEQLELLIAHHKVPVIVGASHVPIPLSFVIDHVPIVLDAGQLKKLQEGFVLPNLSRIEDKIPNSEITAQVEVALKPMALFGAERVDFSLHRLQHYTATLPLHFQSFILLTNYHRYIEAFIEYSREQLRNNHDYIELVGPGNIVLATAKNPDLQAEAIPYLPQMPAYHLKRKDGQGITFVNIGVGPSNAKTITDHLAVLRPDCWLMVGHCAGLRSTQMLGDYVLAHAYVREDHVLDQDLPSWIPLPPIAEVQVALQQAVANVTDEAGIDLKTRMRTGTLVTTDNRNWELRSQELSERFRQSRAIAVDMESATVAANGFRFRVPYGTLLCVSDKPIHGEIKLQGMANAFYQKSVSQHLKIGLEAVRLLREAGVEQIHSRKLRGFSEPPFR
jgi:AMP nucleosidase